MDADPEEDFLRYCARLSAPERYDPDSPTLGLDAWEYDGMRAIYASASPAVELLAERDALPYRHCEAVPDYWAELPEDAAPTGRVLVPRDARESMSDGGLNGIRTLAAAAQRDGVDIRTSHRVQRLLTSGGAVSGVDATRADGTRVRVRARKAVIFASGGFTHDVELRRNHLSAPVFGGCAALTNEGDFVRIGTPLGAQLRNMNYAWMCPIPLEKAVARDPSLSGMFSVAGDSMLFVDKRGRRVVNEKLPYNELAQTFFEWDATAGEYPNLVLVPVWDQRSQEHSASDEYGRLIVGDTGASDAHVLRGETFEELATAVRDRLAQYAHVTGGSRSPTTGRSSRTRASSASTHWRRPVSTRTSAAASAPSSSCSTATCAKSPAARIRRCGRYPTTARTTRHSSPVARSTPRAAPRPTPTRASSTTSSSRSPASTASATASRRSRAAPTGPAARQSAR